MRNLSPIRLALIGVLVLAGAVLVVSLALVFVGSKPATEVELTATRNSGPSETPGVPTLATLQSPQSTEPLPATAARSQSSAEIRVYIAGAVRRPDVYSLVEGDRLVDAVAAAGGPAEGADLEAVNLALRIRDEGYYYIPSKPEPVSQSAPPSNSPSNSQFGPSEDTTEPRRESSPTQPAPPLAADSLTGELPGAQKEASTTMDAPAAPVNLNTADQAELETLPGIGPARAAAIIGYRDRHGPFTAIEELTAVSGIGQGILDNVRNLVTVGR
ncbi:MAG: hypothetical protein F4X65_09450 [Chloroflexi bacterium]|nr:hypothetical protein [Chloroflexota bacterium]